MSLPLEAQLPLAAAVRFTVSFPHSFWPKLCSLLPGLRLFPSSFVLFAQETLHTPHLPISYTSLLLPSTYDTQTPTYLPHYALPFLVKLPILTALRFFYRVPAAIIYWYVPPP